MSAPRWVRIGIGISAAWVAGAVIAAMFGDIRIARLLRYSAFEVCDYVNHHLCDCGNCWRQLMDFASLVDDALMNVALIALAPIAVAWAGACAAVGICRAVGGLRG
jgi:hypothetical protein